MGMREDAKRIIDEALAFAKPDAAVKRAVGFLPEICGKLIPIAIGKAAWQMAYAAKKQLGERLSDGIVITKHGYSAGEIEGFTVYEAGHPVPDEDTYRATDAVLRKTAELSADDAVLFLVSGGGSALFEKPLCKPEEMASLTDELLASGASITEINAVRKRLSAVKGGKFALHCAPARVFTVALSDVLGDRADVIASGPAYPDPTYKEEVLLIADEYGLHCSDEVRKLLETETPKELPNAFTRITGSVRQLCESAERTCASLGYEPIILTDGLSCEAKEAGAWLASLADSPVSCPTAYICGGETVVKLTGHGLGGRNQELALAAAEGLRGKDGVLLFSVGSDGTDGPTDAAGGIVDGETADRLENAGYRIPDVLRENDSYHALAAVDGLLFTGPTGTNVNDLTVLLIR